MSEKLEQKNSKEVIQVLSKYFSEESHLLVSSVAHDVKNPLGIIDLSVGLLEDKLSKLLKDEDPKVKNKIFKFLDNINVGLEKCEEILDDVLLLRRLDADYEKKQDFSIKELFDNHHIFSKPALKKKNVSIDNNCPEDQMVTVNEKSFTMVLNGAIVSFMDHLDAQKGGLCTVSYADKKISFSIVSKDENKPLGLIEELDAVALFREEVFHRELEKTGYGYSLDLENGIVKAQIRIP